MDKRFAAVGAVFGFTGVALGAFGAHALSRRLTADLLDIFEVGVRYHMYHALAIVAVGLTAARWPGSRINLAGWMFVAGILIFSGSLYLLALTQTRWWGAVTPIGGAAFMAGWAMLAWHIWRAEA